MSAPVKFMSYNRRVYRNFATVAPSQSLMDDLVDREAERNILDAFYVTVQPGPKLPLNSAITNCRAEWLRARLYGRANIAGYAEYPRERLPFYYTRDIPPALSRFERSLKRSPIGIVRSEIDAKFHPDNWHASRYSDGSWSVLYAAETEKTALYEAVFHLRNFYREELHDAELAMDRRVCTLLVKSIRCVDVLKTPNVQRKHLTSMNRSGYPYCQRLARRAIKAGAEILIAPSARHPKGTSVAIFDKKAVTDDEGHLKYVKLVLTRKACRILAEEEVVVFEDGGE